MKTADFDFDLPEGMIAQIPACPREAARLLILGDLIEDKHVSDLPGFLRPGDLLIVNDTKVLPTRLSGVKGQARIEVTLIKRLGDLDWQAFARPAKKLKPGDLIDFAPDLKATVVRKDEGGEITLSFQGPAESFAVRLDRVGRMPLPPYIKRASGDSGQEDRESYQTLFAEREGAVAAPTAGLHFTPSLYNAIKSKGINFIQVTLHVGAGTFLPVKTDDPRDHKMHSEWGEVSPEAAQAVNQTRQKGGRVVAVGTTSLRILESATAEDGTVFPFQGETDIFILPGYRFRSVDLLMTNFHLPRSTLFMLVSAFAGLERVKAAYAHAVEEGYRFFSYGDASLIYPKEGA
ncbi:MAG: tRNA preQ1(34) S-adenosylmethionine ribosyltransferase-isomerase QueA [Alphaproteobacteria bacterium]|nr:tRNA preQ1(34) S-adenosylmethionine ribosyltransferase-isomerase QueA [Alphaproteobacteria bacterium]